MADELKFQFLLHHAECPNSARNVVFLRIDDWDDRHKYRTQFVVTIYDVDGNVHEIGKIKIGQRGLKPSAITRQGHRTPSFSWSPFPELDESYFSLGQDESYYENLAKLDDDLRQRVLKGLRDVAFNSDIWEQTKDEEVMEKSLLRHITPFQVKGQLRRMANGGLRLTPYHFSFRPPKRSGEDDPDKIDFCVSPESKPPTNVHVFIGRNGVGKTHLLGLMTKALVASEDVARQSGRFRDEGNIFFDVNDEGGTPGFANLVAVSFNAFDDVFLMEAATQKAGLTYQTIYGADFESLLALSIASAHIGLAALLCDHDDCQARRFVLAHVLRHLATLSPA